jgi:hypothetical protein
MKDLENVRERIDIKIVFLVLLFASCLALGLVLRPAENPSPPGLQNHGNVTFAGVRSSSYGIEPFPAPAGWENAIETMSSYFMNSTPCAIWIVGEMSGSEDCHLFFPSDGKEHPHIQFDSVDKHEEFLTAFDEAGISVFLQVEPANADMITLIDLVLGRYEHHPCVIGFGVDVEWYREADSPGRGVKVDDTTAQEWEARVKSHNPEYRLFLKHWDSSWMPPTYRGGIIFVDDGQQLRDLNAMVDEFVNVWANHFYPNVVFFQVGYPSDRPWWGQLTNPPKTIGDALQARTRQDCGIFWVDFTLRETLPTGEDGNP